MKTLRYWAALGLLVSLACVGVSCRENRIPTLRTEPQPEPEPPCVEVGDLCTTDGDCCFGNCDDDGRCAEPGKETEPDPLPQPEPDPLPQPEPDPLPQPEPDPEPDPLPQPEPDPDPDPSCGQEGDCCYSDNDCCPDFVCGEDNKCTPCDAP